MNISHLLMAALVVIGSGMAYPNELPTAPTNDEQILAEVFDQAQKELGYIDGLLQARRYGDALARAKKALDDARIKSGIHPRTSYREKIQLPKGTLSQSYKAIGQSIKDLDLDAQDTVMLTVDNYRAGYFLDILNLLKRINLQYIVAFQKTLEKNDKLLDRDREKIKEDILSVHAIPLYLKDEALDAYFLVFDHEIANSDQNYLFNRELMEYLLENRRKLDIRNEAAIEKMLRDSEKSYRDDFIRSYQGNTAASAASASSSREESTNMYTTANFKQCFNLMYASTNSVAATRYCEQNHRYNFLNPEFLSCFHLYYASTNSVAAVRECRSKVR